MSKSDKRRSATIHAYVGPNGGGKSLAMMADTIASLKMGRPVLSTVLLLDANDDESTEEQRVNAWGELGLEFEDGARMPAKLPHPLFVPLTEWVQLVEWTYGDVLLDEVTGVADAYESQQLPPAVRQLLDQMRRADIALRWTTPSYERGAKRLRGVTQAVTYCRGYMPVAGTREEQVEEPETGEVETITVRRLWGHNRLFYWRTYDGFAFEEFTSSKRENVTTLCRQLYWRRNGGGPQEWYDTLAPVTGIRDVTEHGTCMRCGGRRRRPACKCPETPTVTANAA